MLYVIHGTDTKKTRQKLTELTEALQKKRPDASLMRMGTDTWNASFLDEILSGVSLFAPKNIIILDGLLSFKESQETILDRIADLAASEHVCILIEEKINKETLKKLEKKAEKIQEHNTAGTGADGSAAKKKEFPQTFAFADALASRDQRKAWTLFQKLTEDSLAAEEVHGVLWWQFKSIFLAASGGSAKAAGLNPYVFQKCQTFSKKWSERDLRGMLDGLVSMYHKAHRGEIDFISELEALCLK